MKVLPVGGGTGIDQTGDLPFKKDAGFKPNYQLTDGWGWGPTYVPNVANKKTPCFVHDPQCPAGY